MFKIRSLAGMGRGRLSFIFLFCAVFALSVSNIPSEIEQTTKLANEGNAEAQFNLGILYAKGRGVPQDYKQAHIWLQKAADQGDASAQTSVGLLYALGMGVPQDYKQACMWLQKAADQGYVKAQDALTKLSKH